MDTNNDLNFIGRFAGSLRDRRAGLDPDPSGGDSIHISGSTPQLKFDVATSITTNGRIPISEGLQATSGKGKFQPENRNACEKCNDGDDDELFIGFDDKSRPFQERRAIARARAHTCAKVFRRVINRTRK